MPEARAIAGAVAAVVACAGGVWGLVASQACQLQGQCDAQTFYVPALSKEAAGTGALAQGFQAGAGVDAYGSWQSSPIEGEWMFFPGQRTYVIYPKLPDGGAFEGPYVPANVQISADKAPYTNGGSNFAPSAGNTTEFSGLPDGGLTGFQITNNTCSPYYLWLQITQEYPSDADVRIAAPVPQGETK